MTHSPTTPANPSRGVSKLLERSADHVKMAKAIGNFGIASRLVAELSEALTAAIGAGGQAVAQFRKAGCSDWYDGLPYNEDGRGPYETRTLYSHPAPSGQAVAVKPLVWEPGVVDWAKPLPGMKYVACSTTPAGSWAWWLEEAPETRAVFSSEQAAKAAAQADYERRILSALSQPHPADERVVEALPRPDAVSMASGTICLEYVDRAERDLAFDWLEAHGAGVALAASHMPVGDGQKYRLPEAGEIIASDDEFIGDDGITWERVKGWPVGYTYTHIFKSCRRPLAAARAREDGK